MKLKELFLVGLTIIGSNTNAATYTEDFNAPFPNWEVNWFGINSDARNFYCPRPCADRGNNPDGLWLASLGGPTGPSALDVTFSNSFGGSISSLSIDVAAYRPTNLLAYDSTGIEIFRQSVTLTSGAFSYPGKYAHYTVTSANGISRFSFDGVSVGSVSIDNISVNSAVPEPGITGLLLFGLALLGWQLSRKNQYTVNLQVHEA